MSIILPQIFQNHMILQREKTIRLWGQVSPEIASVRVVLRCADSIEESAICPAEEGTFYGEIKACPAGIGYTMNFYENDNPDPEKTLTDIGIGDLWIAGGQSNMEYFLRYEAHWNELKKEESNPQIRMFQVPRLAFAGQKRELPDSGCWFTQDDPAWPLFSAPGYYFAREIQPDQKVPVGIIGCNWGGTSAACWTREEYLQKEPLSLYVKEYLENGSQYQQKTEESLPFAEPTDTKTGKAELPFDKAYLEQLSPEGRRQLWADSCKAWAFEDSYRHQLEWRTMMYGLTWEEQQEWIREHLSDPENPMGPWHPWRPCGLYHTMLETIAPLNVKGVLWYQGESDNEKAALYPQLMEAMVNSFRELFREENLPFLYVQVAPYERWLGDSGIHYPALRQAQEKAAAKIPNIWMTSIMDIGDRDDIHPKEKREVGHRLALLARGKVYGEEILCEAPETVGVYLNPVENKVRITLVHTEGGILCGKDDSTLFIVTQGERQIPVGQVTIAREDAIDLILEEKAQRGIPMRVSFAEVPYCEVHIHNQAGIPLKPFHAVF